MPYYSSNGVDEVIEKLLPEVGFAVDVGANDGQFFSNSLHLEEKGWTVLCVEPNPLLEEQGRSRRKLWRQIAAGAEDRDADFVAIGGGNYASESRVDLPEARGQRFTVKMLTLDRILEEAGFSRLDLMTADVEGYEDEVMKGFTIERWKPTVIVLESLQGPGGDIPGYTRIDRREYDNIYLRKSPEEMIERSGDVPEQG